MCTTPEDFPAQCNVRQGVKHLLIMQGDKLTITYLYTCKMTIKRQGTCCEDLQSKLHRLTVFSHHVLELTDYFNLERTIIYAGLYPTPQAYSVELTL